MGLRATVSFGGTERFRILRRIGEGGMGVVYEADDLERNCRVALKTLRTREPRAILRLKHEFRALQDLEHPNLVRIGELFESEGNWFFSMELIDGVDFLKYVGWSPAAPASSTHADDTAGDLAEDPTRDSGAAARARRDLSPDDARRDAAAPGADPARSRSGRAPRGAQGSSRHQTIQHPHRPQ